MNNNIVDYLTQLDTIKTILESYPLEIEDGTNKARLEFHIGARNERNREVNELIAEYKKDYDLIIKAITKRINKLYPKQENPIISEKRLEIKHIRKLFKYTTIYNDTYEKTKLSKIVTDLDSMESDNLKEINDIIHYVVNKFKLSNINLTKDDFTYSTYTREYMETFLNNLGNPELDKIMENKFNEIYWKCPKLLTHIKLNIRHLSNKYKVELDKYIETRINDLLRESDLNIDNYLYMYINKARELNYLINVDKYLLVNRFNTKELSIDDYLIGSTKRDKVLDSFLKDQTFKDLTQEEKNKYISDILTLRTTVTEAIYINNYSYLIKDIIARYNEKEANKNVYKTRIKDVDKPEAAREALVKKYYSKPGLFHRITDVQKKTMVQDIEKTITELDTLYSELDNLRLNDHLYNDITAASSLYDGFAFANSYYFYLKNQIKANNKGITVEEIDEIVDDFKEFVYNPDTIISKDLNLFNDYDLSKLIKDKCLLLNINVDASQFDDLEGLKKKLDEIANIYYISKLDIDPSDIKFIGLGLELIQSSSE